MPPEQTPVALAAYCRTLDLLAACRIESKSAIGRKLMELYRDQMWIERDSGDMQSESAAAIRLGIVQALRECGHLPPTVSELHRSFRQDTYDTQ